MINLINTASLYASLYETVELCKKYGNEKIEIIIPDKLALFMEKFLFEKLNIKSSFNLHVSTLNRFAKRKCLVAIDNLISDVGSILLIHKILNDNINALSALKSKAYSFSYAENILKTINQFKASKITWQEMEMFKSSNLQLQNKITDLAFVFKQYETLKAGLLDSADFFLMSTKYVSNDVENKKIIFVGFDDFTAIEYSIIEQLAIKSEVNILINFTQNKNKHIFNNEIYSQLKNIAYINQLAFEVKNSEIKFSNLKNFLHENLFAISDNKFCLDKETIKVFSANNVKEELEFVARDIRSKIIEGKNYFDFGVAVFDLESKTNIIKEIFSKYEINYYLDNEMHLNKSILYKFLCSIIKYNLENYNLCHLIDIISSPFIEIDKYKKQKLISELITSNFKGKIKNGFEVSEDIKESLELLLSNLSLFNLDVSSNIASNIEVIKEGLQQLNIADKISKLSLNIDLQNKLLITKSEEQIYNLFDEILKFNSDINLHQFLDIFVAVAGSIKISNLPLPLDVVKIVDANNTMEIFNNLYLVNCTTDTAPNLKNDCGIILDNEIDQLSFKNKLAPTIAHINNLSKLRLYNTSLLFEKNLVITYSQKASDIIKEYLSKIQIKTRVGDVNIVPLRNFEYGKYQALTVNDYIEFLCKNDKNNAKINENLVKNKDFSKISSKNLRIFDDLTEISASYLESYFNCPFFCFMQNGVKIKPREDGSILPFDVGNILHEIIFKYYKIKKKVDDIYEFCKDQVFKFAEKNQRIKLNIKSPILLALIDESVRVISAIDYMDKNSTFVPTLFEYEFKGNKALKLENINIKGKVDRVDISNDLIRVIDYKSGKSDASLKELYYGDKLQLFLYASAMENILGKNSVASFYLPLRNAYKTTDENSYAFKGFFLNEDFVLTAMDTRFEPGYKSDIILTTMDQQFKAGLTKGVRKLTSNEMQTLKSYAKIVSQNAVDEIRSGYIKPSPSGNKNPCGYCPYNHVCLKNSANRVERSVLPVSIDSFKEVESV